MPRDYVLESFRAPLDLKIDYARELNEQQHAAVTAVPHPALVIAGAGAGKTRTLIYRVAFLLEQGVPPERILLLTFTNKAAKEMMHRVSDVLGGDISPLWGGTFHSIGSRILRQHADRLGYRPDFTILDREDTNDLLKACLDDAEIDVKATRFPKASVLADIFSLAANMDQPVAQITAEMFSYFVGLVSDIELIHQHFAARKRRTNVMDFDDLLVLWLKLLRDHEDLRDQYQRRFQFILVDEYQDTNQLQCDLIDLLAARHRNVMAVGDDAQSIYSWRGANFKNILEFPQRYPNAQIYKIETNYRSTPEILALANAAIAPNVNQFAKILTPARPSGIKPVLVTCGDAGEQASFVAQHALELRDQGIQLNDMAVLYRSHFHAMELQMELTRRNIPFSITSGVRFFDQAHVKDVTASLKFVFNPQDELSFKRLVRLLPGIGGKGADKLWRAFSATHATDAGPSPETAADPPAQVPSDPPTPARRPILAIALQACAQMAPAKSATAWAQFTATISQLESLPASGSVSEMIALVLEAGYEDYLQETYPNYRQRLEDLHQLVSFAQQFKSVAEFLSQLALLSNLESDQDRPVTRDDEQIRLSTIHQAKGLEFKVVFLIMLCDGLFPSKRSLERPESEEEERRLFYVALTRAKDELYLSYPLIRLAGGISADIMQHPSRFIQGLSKELVDEWNLVSSNPFR